MLQNFKDPDFFWKSCSATFKWFKRLGEYQGQFLNLSAKQPDQRRNLTAHQHGRTNLGGSRGCSDHALVKFTILRDTGQVVSKLRNLNFRKANFWLFKEFLDGNYRGCSWETALRSKVAEQGCQVFMDIFLRASGFSIPTYKKLDKEDRRPAWLNKDILVRLRCKKKVHRQ